MIIRIIYVSRSRRAESVVKSNFLPCEKSICGGESVVPNSKRKANMAADGQNNPGGKVPFSGAGWPECEVCLENPHPHVEGQVRMQHLRDGLAIKTAQQAVGRAVALEAMDFSPDLRVVLALEGRSSLQVGGETIHIGEGCRYDGVWLPVLSPERGVKYLQPQARQNELVLFVGLDWWAACCHGQTAQPGWLDLPPAQHLQAHYFQISPPMRALAQQLQAQADEAVPPALRRLQQESMAVSLLAEVTRHLLRQNGNVANKPAAAVQKRIERLTALLHSGHADAWTLAQMAAHCHSNPTTLQRHFQECHGVSIAQYLRRLKLARAYHALVDGARVSEAAAAAGYQHLDSFTKAFKQQYHVCPRQVRGMVAA